MPSCWIAPTDLSVGSRGVNMDFTAGLLPLSQNLNSGPMFEREVSPKLVGLYDKPHDDQVDKPDEEQFPGAVNGAENGQADHYHHEYSRQQHWPPSRYVTRRVVAAKSDLHAVADQATGPICLAPMPTGSCR